MGVLDSFKEDNCDCPKVTGFLHPDIITYIIQPCYYALPEFEMIQQGEFLWSLDGSLGEDKKKLITEEKLSVLNSLRPSRFD